MSGEENPNILHGLADRAVDVRYIDVVANDDRDHINAYINSLRADLRLDEMPARAFAVYRGLAWLHSIRQTAKDSNPVKAEIRRAASGLGIVPKQAGASEKRLNASSLRDHRRAIEQAVGHHLPDIKAIAKQCAVMIYVGTICAPADFTPPKNDAWMKTHDFRR